MNDFDKLWDEFNEKLLYYIKANVGNPHDAEDILQNVFIKVFNGVEGLKHHDAIKSWIYKITKNAIIDFYRKKKDISVAPESLYSLEDDDESIDNMNDEIASCIEKMFFELPEKYQEVYNLYEKKSLKHQEIAEQLDISLSASKVRLKRAKEMYKVKLLACCDFEVDKYGNIVDYSPKRRCDDCQGKC